MKLALAAVALATTVARAVPAHHPRIKTVTIDYNYTSFHHNELHYVIDAKPGGGFQLADKAVDGAAIDALYIALTGLHAVDRVQRCISHTDDYPAFKVTIEGERPIELASNSNCHLGVPWMVTERGKLSAQYNGAVGIAVHQLLAAIDPEHWKTPPDSPEAFTGLGGEFMRLDEFTGIQQPRSPATACAKSLRTDPRIHAALGADIVVSHLTLGCDLGASSDCAVPSASASFRWEGVDFTFDLPCLNGKIDANTTVIADLTDVRAFLESKPVSTLKALASNPPHVSREDTWQVETWDDFPSLQYAPGRLVVRARAIATEHGPGGGAFWKALGLDAKQLTHEDKALLLVETSATLDFAGKLIR